MSPAKTSAERQAYLKARRIAAGLVALRNVWVHPDDVPAVRAYAAKLARRRQAGLTARQACAGAPERA